jgi:predicted molibdopterin-dependent oxidoreductase YjgC
VSTASDFTALDPASTRVTVAFDGEQLRMRAGLSLAAGLLEAGVCRLRTTPGGGAPRGPFCMMGACYDCLVEIEGETVQACMTPVRAGLVVKRLPGPNA